MGRGKRILLFCAVVAAGGTGAWYHLEQPAEPAKAARPAPAIPVTTAVAAKRDLPIYLTGLGAVQASFTVGIRPQVDGKLEEVLFTEGQYVSKGDVLAKIDPRLFAAALDQAKAKKQQDEAMLSSAQKDLMRSKTLVDKNFATQQLVDQQQAKVDQLIASISADEAAIETAQTNLDYTSIVAPSDGRMGVRNIDPGNIVHAADPAAIATLTLTRPAAVLFTLSSRFLTDVRDAMARGPVEVTAFDRDNVHELTKGTLLLIDNFVDQASATMRLKATFANQDDKLWPGDFVNARVLVDTKKDVLAVPSPAIQRGPDGVFTWVVKADGVVEARQIEVGPTTGDQTIVTSGVAEGERVVVNGQYKLRAGAHVTATDDQSHPAVAKRDRSS
ncbi:MAG: efflux RND transporter periplasmic adaptor subunit [Bradyrhizobiaceae bacterium]|nr:efflux RND transporter periplasmic adaptor subunit [Bradyrhizobiaceae bacterium]